MADECDPRSFRRSPEEEWIPSLKNPLLPHATRWPRPVLNVPAPPPFCRPRCPHLNSPWSPAPSVYEDNPVLAERYASCLKKWRQRCQGPNHIRYGQNGIVRYELKGLMEFSDMHRVKLGSRK